MSKWKGIKISTVKCQHFNFSDNYVRPHQKQERTIANIFVFPFISTIFTHYQHQCSPTFLALPLVSTRNKLGLSGMTPTVLTIDSWASDNRPDDEGG